MAKYVTVSVKVPKDIKEKMEKLQVEWGRILRQAIAEELQKAERERTVDAIFKLVQRAPMTPEGTSVKLIREMREEIGQEDDR